MKNIDLKFATKAYSEREAWKFLTVNGPELNISIRQLASLWNWHKSKIERFLKVLRTETFIETKISHGKTTITILTNSMVDKANNFITQENFKIKIKTQNLKLDQENLSRDNFEDNNETFQTRSIQCIEQNSETESRQFHDICTLKEEKKKRSKKRKEEIKEKTLLKEGKKENDFFENSNLLDEFFAKDESSKEAEEVLEEISTKLPVLKNYPESVTAEDVIDWAEKNLPKEINIEWELEKFKDYHRSSRNKKIKDAVAYFRNWLRKSAEFKQQSILTFNTKGNCHDKFNNSCQTNQRTTEFERFLAGGARALNKHSWSGLDKQTYR